MAQRRMISLEVIDTDAFLDMPMSSQLLYFHMNARADDDGFVASPKKVIRILGAQTDDFKILIAKKFLINFEDGVCVIKHWRINNFIRKDIYKETKYLDLKNTLFIRPNGAYTQTGDNRAIPLPSGHFKIEDVKCNGIETTLTQRQPRLGKVRVDKDRLDNTVCEWKDDINFMEFYNEYPRKIAPSVAYKSWLKLNPNGLLRLEILAAVKKHKNTDQWQRKIIPHPATFLNQRRWEGEVEEAEPERDVLIIK